MERKGKGEKRVRESREGRKGREGRGGKGEKKGRAREGLRYGVTLRSPRTPILEIPRRISQDNFFETYGCVSLHDIE